MVYPFCIVLAFGYPFHSPLSLYLAAVASIPLVGICSGSTFAFVGTLIMLPFALVGRR